MLRSFWKRFLLHGIQFSDRHQQLNFLYKVEDPWNMKSAAEQHRFSETNSFIVRNFGSIGRLLEIGCGEGHQTLALTQVALDITGLDVSDQAVARARQKVPGGRFLAGVLPDLEPVLSADRFDLVTACEVLYYMSDIPSAVATMERCGRGMVVTYYERYRDRLDPIILAKPDVVVERISHGDMGWTIACWRT
jgi:SAM-dependent methyltransferase